MRDFAYYHDESKNGKEEGWLPALVDGLVILTFVIWVLAILYVLFPPLQ